MLAVLALLAGTVLLALGYVTEQPGLAWAALGLGVLAMFLVLLPYLPASWQRSDAEPVVGPDARADGDDEDPDPPRDDPSAIEERRSVVFQPGKLTFHVAGCSELEGVQTSVATRAQLEAGGMKPCPHCLTVAG